MQTQNETITTKGSTMDNLQYQHPHTETQLLEETVKAIHEYDVDRVCELKQIVSEWSQMENERSAQLNLLVAIESLLDMALNN